MSLRLRARKQRPVAEINITPLTDVVLVLLVIFMITTPLIYQSNIKVKLPQVSSAKPDKILNQVDIAITEKRQVYFGDKVVTVKELSQKVDLMHKYNPDLTVVLYADKTVPFRDIVTVLGVINEAGISDLNIAVELEEKAPAAKK